MKRLEYMEEEEHAHVCRPMISSPETQEEQTPKRNTTHEPDGFVAITNDDDRRQYFGTLDKYNECNFKDSGYQGDDEDDFSDLKSAITELNGELLKKQSMITELENRIVQLKNEATLMKQQLDDEKEENDNSLLKRFQLREKLINEKVKTTEKHLN